METSNSNGKTLKVLVIDPDRSMRSRFDCLLRNYEKQKKLRDYVGYSLSYSYNMVEGRRRAKREKPDLVILETSFEGGKNLDGIEQVLKPLLALRGKKGFTGKVFCWSYRDHQDIATKFGADKFIRKDKDLTKIRTPIDVFLGYREN